jgi:histidinol-phosphatase
MNSPYIPIAIKAVKEAEKVILKHFQNDVEVSYKADETPVTVADKRAEEIIRKIILAEFHDHTFFGEEGGQVNLRNHKGYTWIIDPIDGTRCFIRGIPTFGTLLALLHDGEIIAGVSNVPAMGELMYAATGEGTFLNGKPVKVSGINDPGKAYLSSGSLKYFEKLGLSTQLLELGRKAEWARGIGDAWAYHLVAQGKVDIMMEGDISYWDIAAGKILIEEAGGKVTRLDGQPLDYRSTTVLATNGALHETVLAAMKAI